MRQAILLLSLTACPPSPHTPAPYDAGDGGRTPCQTDQLATDSRLIRGPDGKPMVIPCADAGPMTFFGTDGTP